MSTEDLRKNLGKSKVEAQRHLDIQEIDRAKTNRNFQHWNKALEAFALGWRRPKPRYPVIISPNSIVSTPQKLQELAGMATTPRVINTTYTTMNGKPDDAHLQADGEPEQVQVGEVSWHELDEIQNKTECEDFLFVFVDGKVRHTILVKSFKGNSNGVDQEAHVEIQEDKLGMSPQEAQTT